MADLVLVYGMRLLPADEVAAVAAASVRLKNGNEAQVTMHILEGSRARALSATQPLRQMNGGQSSAKNFTPGQSPAGATPG